MTEVRACLCGCRRVATVRGLFASCAAAVNRRIRSGKTTEAAEIAAGRMLSKKKRGPRPMCFGQER